MTFKLCAFCVVCSLLCSSRIFAQHDAEVQSDLFAHKRINVFQGVDLPNSVGSAHYDSIARNRSWRIDEPRIYAYVPGLEERNGAAIIIIPGGGYVKQAFETSGVSLAKWCNTFGVTAFVLLHRLPNQPDLQDGSVAPVQDAQRAVKWVRAHASDFGVDPRRIGVMGCSAGAHLSACVASLSQDFSKCGDSLDSLSPRPDFAILVSPAANIVGSFFKKAHPAIEMMMQQFRVDKLITSASAPMLCIHASDDPTVNPLNSIEIYRALQLAGVSQSSIHIFPNGAHRISLRSQPGSTALWPQIAEDWLREIGMIP